jgi:transcriptional regulator with XRE-family HTH domain
MNFNSSEEIQKAFQDLIKKSDENVDIPFLAEMVMYRFLSEVERLTEERKMTRKELAQQIGTSASYITQLYRGNKLLNLTTIAKFEKALGITFTIKADVNIESENQIDFPDHLQSLQLNHPDTGSNQPATGRTNRAQSLLAQEPKSKYSRKKPEEPQW